MHDKPGVGLSKNQLERELRWMLHQQPSDPTKLVEFVGDLVVSLIDRNNQALQRAGIDPNAPIDPPSGTTP